MLSWEWDTDCRDLDVKHEDLDSYYEDLTTTLIICTEVAMYRSSTALCTENAPTQVDQSATWLTEVGLTHYFRNPHSISCYNKTASVITSSSSSNVSSERRSKRPRCSAHNTSYRVKQTILI